MSGIIKARGMVEGNDGRGSLVFRLLWTKDGNFDNRPGALFQPNHFVPVIQYQSAPKLSTLSLWWESQGLFHLSFNPHPNQVPPRQTLLKLPVTPLVLLKSLFLNNTPALSLNFFGATLMIALVLHLEANLT